MNIISSDAVPKVSVLIPVYNAEKYLSAALDSVLVQTLVNFELLALDDGSVDASLDILKDYEAKDNRIRIWTREHRGLGQTRNELVSHARGRYLAAMDADDICLPARLERQAAFLDSADDYVAVGGWIEQINSAAQPIGIIRTPIHHDEIDQVHLKGHVSIPHPSAMIRTTALARVGGYRPESAPAEDLDLWLRLAEVGKIANIPHVVLRYRLHASSLSEKCRDLQRICARVACEEAWRRRGIEGTFEMEYWRPGRDRDSRHKFALQYAWVAWSNNHRATWWTHTREALLLRPLAISTWRLLVFGFLRTPHKQAAPDI